MKDLVIAIFILFGAVFILISAIGLLRFNDLFSRMHATTKATSFGILLLVAGVGLFFSAGIIWLKAAIVVIFIYLTAPLAAHAIAKSFDEKRQNDED